MSDAKESWHLDKKVPIALIGALMFQTVGFGVWMGSIQTRVDNVEAWQGKNDRMDARLSVLESQLGNVSAILERIENKIDNSRAQP